MKLGIRKGPCMGPCPVSRLANEDLPELLGNPSVTIGLCRLCTCNRRVEISI